MSLALKNKEIMEAIFQKLEDTTIDEIPYFMINSKGLSNEKELMTPFEYSVRENHTTNVRRFIHFMTISD